MPFYKFYKFYMLILSELQMLQLSTFFYKVLQRSMRDSIFLHFSINSTLYLICWKCNMLIYRLFRLVETCRTCRTGISMFCRETFFFWALPFRSGYTGVSSSMIFHVADSRWSFAMLQYISHSCAPLLSLTQWNAGNHYHRDTCPLIEIARQSGITAQDITAAPCSTVKSCLQLWLAGFPCWLAILLLVKR